jgi:solute carrier family 13 (sodium-dependent dicarboxylate transporter), member 2/3/5
MTPPPTRRLWRYLWRVNERTKAYLRLDGVAIAADVGASEREILEKAFADGGEPSESSQASSEPSNDGGGNGGDGGSPFDVGGDYGARKKVGFVLGPLLFALLVLAAAALVATGLLASVERRVQRESAM